MDPKNYYKILGVPHDASQSQINHAYRELAKKWHPDINHAPNAGKMFTKINQAYSVLGNKKKRAAYDQFGSSDASTGFGGNGTGFNGFGNGFNGAGFGNAGFGGSFNDIFNQFFNHDNSFFNRGGNTQTQTQTQEPKRGADLGDTITIDFTTAAFGGKSTTDYERTVVCPKCNGSGAEPGSSEETCPTCHGSGRVISVVSTAMGQASNQRTCPTCHGTGKIIRNKCSRCGGTGTVRQNHQIEFDIPAGIDNGQKLRLKGQGQAGKNGGSYGDLYLTFKVRPSKNFKRKGDDVYRSQPISVSTAMLGGTVNVKALDRKHKSEDGVVSLKIPSGTQSETTFRLKDLGINNINTGNRGDEKVTVHIQIPKHLNHKQKQAIIAFSKASGGNNNSIFGRMKNAFDN